MLRGLSLPLWLLPILVTTSADALSDASSPSWTVIGTIGKWECARCAEPNQNLIGARLEAGNILRREGSPKTGSITLLNENKGHWTIACDDPASLPDHNKNGCVDPIPIDLFSDFIKAKPEKRLDGALTILLAGVQKLFTADSATYYKTVSRDYAGLEDGVLAEQSGSVVLTPLLATLSKGSYQLKFASTHTANASDRSVATSNVVWDPEAKGQPVEVRLAPGLYVVSATAASGDPAGEAWILIVPASQAQAKVEAFNKMKTLTDSWKEDSPAASIRAVNRAALDELSRQQ